MTEDIKIALLTQSLLRVLWESVRRPEGWPQGPVPARALAARGGGVGGSPGVGSCTDLGDREEPLCKGTGQPGAQVWPCFSGPSFVSASPKTTFFLPKEQSLDPLLMLRGNFQYTVTS